MTPNPEKIYGSTSIKTVMCKNCAIALGVAAVACLGAGLWMYQSKWRREKMFLDDLTNDLRTPEDRILDFLNPKKPVSKSSMTSSSTEVRQGGCTSFARSCTPGDVGGCQQYKQTCDSADNSVRMTMQRPGECDQFRSQCALGEYASCDLYNRGCLHEED